MRIVFIDSICDPVRPGTSGLSDIVWALANEVRGLANDVSVVGLYEQGFIVPTADIPVCAIRPFHRRNIFTHIGNSYRLVNAARREKSDVVHIVDSVTAGMASICGLGPCAVYHAHSNPAYHARNAGRNPWTPSIYVLMLAAAWTACRKCAAVISLGPSLDREWRSLGAEQTKIFHLPNGIAESKPAKRSEVAGRVLYVGRLSKEKGGVEELVEAFTLLPDHLHLLIAGKGELAPKIKTAVEALGLSDRISLLGHCSSSEINRLYAESQLVVLPSRSEMMPRVMLEAWSAGVAFAATPIGAIPDYLKDGINGYLIPYLTPQAIAETIRRAFDQTGERGRIAESARASASDLNWRQVAVRLAEVYQRVDRMNSRSIIESTSS